jgi:hypothetical protein
LFESLILNTNHNCSNLLYYYRKSLIKTTTKVPSNFNLASLISSRAPSIPRKIRVHIIINNLSNNYLMCVWKLFQLEKFSYPRRCIIHLWPHPFFWSGHLCPHLWPTLFPHLFLWFGHLLLFVPAFFMIVKLVCLGWDWLGSYHTTPHPSNIYPKHGPPITCDIISS